MSRLAPLATIPRPTPDEPDVLDSFGTSAPLHFQRADANDDDYVVAATSRALVPESAAASWTPPVRDVEALMQQFDEDPVQVVIRVLTLAHEVQRLAERITALDRAVSERLEGGARGPSIEQMRDRLSGLLGREIL